MNWLALSPLETLLVWLSLAGIALWLYLHHRRPQRRRVSTLRFWASVQPVSQPRRRKLREPWAFAAQVLFLLLVILALANPRWGTAYEGRSVAIVFDASIWSRMRPVGQPAWLDQERADALAVVDALLAGDRVLLLRAEADAPPILPFTADHAAIRRAILNAKPSSAAADLPRALATGRAALGGTRRGLLVYVGPGLIDPGQERTLNEFRAEVESPDDAGVQPQFLMRLAGTGASIQNRGITRLSLRRDAAQPDRWRLLTQLKNYSQEKSDAVLAFSVNGQPIGQRKVSMAAGSLSNAEEEFTWDKGGMLQVDLSPTDSLQEDDRALINLPTFRMVHVAVFAGAASPFAADLLGVLSSNPYVQAQILPPELSASAAPDIAIYQAASVPDQQSSNAIWFVSGPQVPGSKSVRATGWNVQHPATRWVRTRDISVRNPADLKVEPGDTVLAYAEGDPPKPLIVAREKDGRRILIVGFNPHDSNFPLESAFPLLMAGSVEWMTHSVDEAADSLSAGEIDLPGPATKIVSPSGKEVSFARKGTNVHFFASEAGMYRITGPGGETGVAINPPPLPSERVQLTQAEAAGIEAEPIPPASWDFWRWLVVLAMFALVAEWLLYYSAKERQRAAEFSEPAGTAPPRDANDAETTGELPDERPGARTGSRDASVIRNPNLVGR
jgi:hypothetical protein